MRAAARVSLLVLLAPSVLRVSSAEEPLHEQAFPWPVATLDVPARLGASLAIRLGTDGSTREVVVGPHASLVLESAAPPGGPALNAEATLELLRGSVAERDRAMWKAAGNAHGLVILSGPDGVTGLAEQVPEPGSGRGAFAFRTVVLPDVRYLASSGEARRTRFQVWPGTEQEFDDYRRAEAARWREARASGAAYVPSSPARYVAPKANADTGQDDAFEVLETPTAPDEDFDGTMIERASVGRGHRGEPVTLFEIARSRQAAFEAWTARNVGLPLAIVLDGRVVLSPTVNSPLRDSVQVTLGSTTWNEAQVQAQRLMATLLKARAAALRVVAVVGPWNEGRRLVHVPLAGPAALTVRVRAGGEAQDVGLRARYVVGAPGADEASRGLQVALAVGALGSEWARAHVARFPRAALLAALREEHARTSRAPIQADLLDLLGRLGADEPESARLLVQEALRRKEAALRALAREGSRTSAVFEAVVHAAAQSPDPVSQAAALLERLVTGDSAPPEPAPPKLLEQWRALRTNGSLDVRVLAVTALLVHGAAEPGDRPVVEAFLARHGSWRWAPTVRELLRRTPRSGGR